METPICITLLRFDSILSNLKSLCLDWILLLHPTWGGAIPDDTLPVGRDVCLYNMYVGVCIHIYIIYICIYYVYTVIYTVYIYIYYTYIYFTYIYILYTYIHICVYNVYTSIYIYILVERTKHVATWYHPFCFTRSISMLCIHVYPMFAVQFSIVWNF